MKQTIRIGDTLIGLTRPTLVVAEIGVNHDGDECRAMDLVHIAEACGADAVKLQVFRADRLMHPSAGFAEYQKSRCAETSPIDMLRRYELSTESLVRICDLVRSLDLIPLATPFSPGDVAILKRLDIPAIKIASPDIVNRPLLSAAAALGRPMLLSTGAASRPEIVQAVGWIRQSRNPLCLLHCISSYPVMKEAAHLGWIGSLASDFGVPIGYSDHTTEPMAGAFAVMAGAVLVERHLTYDRTAAGPDHAASSDSEQFASYVRSIRLADAMCGSGGRRVLPIETDVRRVSRQSVVLRRSLRGGHVLGAGDLTVQRPGIGISAADIDTVIGSRLRADCEAGTMLQWGMLFTPAEVADAA
ncbi:MAG TPA: N-acetylneuraminate synthase family protein [Tepidisphaeraceae bacterium]|jgi:sialic acid synthase SpsE|nr:N-acetylneuraminate synthase family protein [Tepidisphaeraceae bacterium]